MRKLQILLILLILLSKSGIILGQISKSNNLKIGDKVPDFEFNIYVNGIIKKVHLNDYKGKFLIFDSWGSSCPPCVAFMPEVRELQEKYKNKLQIIYSTDETIESINSFLKRQSSLKNPNQEIIAATKLSPFVYSDSIVRRMFHFFGWGDKAWIDSEGRLQYRSLDPVSENAIKTFLADENVTLSKFEYPTIFSTKNWFKERVGYQDHMINYSILTKYDEKVHTYFNEEMEWETDSASGKISGITLVNVSIPELYEAAKWGHLSKILHPNNPNQIIFQGKKATNYYYNSLDSESLFQWNVDNQYCYALRIHHGDSTQVVKKMINDLNEYFNMESTTETRKVKSLILRSIKNLNFNGLTSKGGKWEESVGVGKSGIQKLHIQNDDWGNFGSRFYQEYVLLRGLRTPFFDETNYHGKIDLDIAWGEDNWSIDRLNKELKRFGLILIEEERERDVLVLTEKSKL